MDVSTEASAALSTSQTLATTSTTDKIAYTEIAGVFIAIFLVAIIGNSIVIYVLFRKRNTWNVTTTYLFNLAIADAIFVCTLPLWAQTYHNRLEWKFGLAACKIVGVVTIVNMYASIFFLTAMSVDRWIAVVHATTISTVRTSVRARCVCIVVWFASLLLSIPKMIYQVEKEYSPGGGPRLNTNATVPYADAFMTPVTEMEFVLSADEYTTTRAPTHRPVRCTFYLPVTKHKKVVMGLIEFMQAVVGFVIPMTVICICYLRIVRTVRLKLISKRVRKERVAVLAALVVTAFFVCWLPNQLMTLYSALAGWWDLFPFNETFYHIVYPFCICLAYANSCVNPFVYAFTATNFKNNIKEVCGSHKRALSYKMTVARGDSRTPHSPRPKSTNNNNGSSYKKSKNEKPFKAVMMEDAGCGFPVREVERPLNQPVNAPHPLEERHRTPQKLEPLAVVDETTSGIYYEYYSAPPALETVPERGNHKVTTRADIINHGEELSTETHHEWCPPNQENGKGRMELVLEEIE